MLQDEGEKEKCISFRLLRDTEERERVIFQTNKTLVSFSAALFSETNFLKAIEMNTPKANKTQRGSCCR